MSKDFTYPKHPKQTLRMIMIHSGSKVNGETICHGITLITRQGLDISRGPKTITVNNMGHCRGGIPICKVAHIEKHNQPRLKFRHFTYSSAGVSIFQWQILLWNLTTKKVALTWLNQMDCFRSSSCSLADIVKSWSVIRASFPYSYLTVLPYAFSPIFSISGLLE